MYFKSFLTRVLILCLTGASQGQLKTYLYFNQAFGTNPFRYPEPQESWLSTFEGGIQYNLSNASIGYNGSYTKFSDFDERDYYWHQLYLSGALSTTRLGVYVDQRLNQDYFKIYNYTAMTAYLNQYLQFSSINLNLTLNGILNNYAELDEIDNYELNGTARLNKSFATRTTLIAGVGIHYKKYTTNVSYTDTISFGTGNGPRQSGSENNSQTLLQNIEIQAPNVSQLQYWFRIAQSISEGTGIAAQFRARKNINGATRFLSGFEYVYIEESEIFDDPMGFELQSIGVEITQILPIQMILKASSYSGKKSYTAQGIFLNEEIFDSNTLRNDTYTTAQVNLQKNFSINQFRMQLQLWYRWLKNDSNSYWYNYIDHYGSISVNLNF